MRIWWFKNSFVFFVKIDWSFEDFVLLSIELLNLRSVNNNFFNKNFSQIFEQLKLSLFANYSSSFSKLIKPGLNTFIDSFFNGFIQKLSQLFFSQLVDVIESVRSKLLKDSGVVDNELKSFGLVGLDEIILVFIVDFLSESVNVVAFVSVVDFVEFKPSFHFSFLVG